MTCEKLAALLMRTPGANILLRFGSDWVEVVDVKATGNHRNAVTLTVQNPDLGGGVIVVDNDMTPLNQT